MAQNTNLNISPYFDDFDSSKQFYKVLFNPGRPVQARELTTLQSLLQNQVETFGSHIFKEGSMVIPGGVTFDSQFYAVKLNLTNFGVDISLYLDKLVGKKIKGDSSGVTARVQYVQLVNSEIEYPTIYVKYLDSDNNFIESTFLDGENLTCNEDIVYGNTTISANTTFASLIDLNATAIGSSVSIDDGIYFIRGYFVKVNKETIILDYYNNTPSYRIGLKIEEQIVTYKEDSSLYDNAKGFTNYAAPGADRFKISTNLIKKELSDFNDTDFIELMRVGDGNIKKIQTKSSQYSLIRDYLAQRTYDESGDYSTDPFSITINNSLNDRLGNDGLFLDSEKTSQGNTPSPDLMCVKVSPGKAYVRGYDVQKTETTILDVEKPRDTQFQRINVPFEMGNLLRVNNVVGVAQHKQTIGLYDQLRSSTSSATGNKIGEARVYTFKLTDSKYVNSSTVWDLYLYDVQTYTELNLNQSLSTAQLPISSFVKGKNSGASGYAVYNGNGNTKITLRQTSGSFIRGEQLIINGVETTPRSISSIRVFNSSDIKSVFQSSNSGSGFPDAFVADAYLEKLTPKGFSPFDKITIETNGVVTGSGKNFAGISTGSIIRYQVSGLNLETFNKVVSVDSTGTSMTVSGISTVTGVFNGGLPTSSVQTTFALGISNIRNQEKGFLYSELPNKNISSINLEDSNLSLSYQITGESTDASGVLSFSDAQVLGISSSFFRSFDVENYSVHYSGGGIATVTSDQFSLSGNIVTIRGLDANESDIVVNSSILKNGIKSKVKTYNASKTVNISFSKYEESGSGISTSVNDGLTYNEYYGLRVQDEEICLNHPDVVKIVAVYESLDSSDPILDTIQFNATANVDVNAIIGENIIGTNGCVARVVTKPSTNTLGVVYLNQNRFSRYEIVTFEESNLSTEIELITVGAYKNITNNFILDGGQKEQYYDYSRLVRRRGAAEPSRKILVIFDYYTVPSNEDGDLFTVLSYSEDRYENEIPTIGGKTTRLTDVLDFRPRVPIFTPTSATASPFDFSSRSFGSEPTRILTPNGESLIGYDHYLGRIDKIYLDKFGNFILDKGISSTNPKESTRTGEIMEIATIILPPYLYSPSEAVLSITDNRRYTMRDIGKIDDRLTDLERVTSLSLLEVNTKSLQIQDADGLDRFKTGFFADDFRNTDLIDKNFSSIQVDPVDNLLRPVVVSNSLKSQIAPSVNISDENLDLSTNFDLIDSNVKKSGQFVTLNYTEVDWIEQVIATKVENVNPFHVVEYVGTIGLSPEVDSWVRVIRLEESITNRTIVLGGGSNSVSTSISSRDVLLSSGNEKYMRSRNVGFEASNLKPLTRFYQFLDGNGSVDFIPKLIEISPDVSLQNYGSNGVFEVGETVIGVSQGKTLIRFRVASSNHKFGPFNNPTEVFNINPYNRELSLPESYSGSSYTLNVDTFSLSEEAQGKYSGYVTNGMQLIGQTSGAVAYIKDLRLISDNYGDLIGSFFLKNPHTTPPPQVRIETGAKSYKLTSSSSNQTPLPGSKLISSAETVYRSEGVWEQRQVRTEITTLITVRQDPLAQTFTVGGNFGKDVGNNLDDDSNGCFLTAVDLFFASIDSGNSPITIEVRNVEFGAPTLERVGLSKTLYPKDIVISNNAELPTKIIFDYPIYLAPGRQYAIVALAPESIEYELWIAEMGENAVNTATLPNAESVRYTKQFAIGRLYKSQNGGEWSANDYQDLKFKLYKANFTSNSGTAIFYNPSLDESNSYVQNLTKNPITTFSRKATVGIVSTSNPGLTSVLTPGRKVSDGTKSFNYGYVVGTGSSVASVGVTTSGENYSGLSQTNVSTFAITGQGSGLTLDLTINTTGKVTIATIVNRGNGYSVGDLVGIVTSTAGGTGTGAEITVTASNGIDTLYLDRLQGQSFNIGSKLAFYDNSGSFVSMANTTVRTFSQTNVTENLGNYFRVNHFDHGMYSPNNKLTLSNIDSSEPPTTLTSTISSSDIIISVASTSGLSVFEGVGVGASNRGYIKINDEIIGYESVGNGTIETVIRGIDSTIPVEHQSGSLISKYELDGVSLRRINTTHNISEIKNDIDGYFVAFDRSTNGIDRSSDGSLQSCSQLSFNKSSITGGENVLATENIQYDTIIPKYSVLTPSSDTNVTAAIRTVSGTSVSGSEVSFNDLGFETVQLNAPNKLSSIRIVCSKINELTYLNSLPRNKSFTTSLTLSSSDKNVSPIIDLRRSEVEFRTSLLNNPVLDYVSDRRTNSFENDPHIATYVSNLVRLDQPANALKVILSANRPAASDFRVLYSLVRPDSSEISQAFELFPGYDNLTTDLNGDGYLDVINLSKNNGRPDRVVSASLSGQFLEYEYTASNLGFFSGYVIKIVMSGTDQANPPLIKDLRTIALV